VEQAATLSGRIPLWRSGLGYFYDRPLLGYGFNAFETPQRILELERKAGWAAATFHSEYFDLLLGVGCIGAITYVFILLSGLRRTLLLYKLHRSKYYAMECAIVVFFLAAMFLENPGRDPNVPTFVFFAIMARRGLLREPDLHASQFLLAVKGNLKWPFTARTAAASEVRRRRT
jgi:O-antigen ligase